MWPIMSMPSKCCVSELRHSWVWTNIGSPWIPRTTLRKFCSGQWCWLLTQRRSGGLQKWSHWQTCTLLQVRHLVVRAREGFLSVSFEESSGAGWPIGISIFDYQGNEWMNEWMGLAKLPSCSPQLRDRWLSPMLASPWVSRWREAYGL